VRQRQLRLKKGYPLDPRRIQLPEEHQAAARARHQTCVLDNGLFVEVVILDDTTSSILLMHRFPTHLRGATEDSDFAPQFRFFTIPSIIVDFTVIEPYDLMVVVVVGQE